jgi:hypothetical protein
VGSLLFVPVFKTVTHLPPYLGMLWGLGLVWLVTEIIHKSKNETHRTSLSVVGVLRKVDVPSVLFFLGILTAVAALQTAGHLILLADVLRESIGNLYLINIIIGVLSSIVDNVPLVAGAMGMYNFPPDHYFWEFLAYCAGTGGSLLIIGSAAGVAVMGMEKIDFIWYMKKISLLALVGYLAGAGVYYIQEETGLVEYGEEKVAVNINLNNHQEVVDYLVHHEFYAVEKKKSEAQEKKSHEEEGEFIHFINTVQNGETFIGFSKEAMDNNHESWGGTLQPGKLIIENASGDMVKIKFLDKVYFMNSAGELFESPNGKINNLTKHWKRKEFEVE